VRCGLKDKVWPAFKRYRLQICRKLAKPKKKAKQSKLEVKSNEVNSHYEKVGDYIVYRSDRKVMKNINYFRPDLPIFTEEQLSKFNLN
jgi:uncharacterized protein YqfA (UPF0365 family)